jgi:predicted SAM-dependent methyltransferase
MTDSIKLDLGAGVQSPEGYIPLGHDHGTEIFPLSYDDNSVDVVRASHVIEHFPHGQIEAVLKEWVRVLKPGGILRIAVPDFEELAKRYLDGKLMDAPAEWFVMGSQTDASDFHKSLFDREHLRQRLAVAGLVLLRPWKSELEDCASYDVSLNIEGTKPAVSEMKVSASMSVPRLAFMDNFGCCFDALVPLGIRLRRQGGAFWGQALTKCLEMILEKDQPDAILTLDYDTIFTKTNVARLIELMMAHPEADAIAALQSSRHLPTALFTVLDEDGKALGRIPLELMSPDLTKIATAHFGLTLIRADKLRSLPKPWFHSVPDEDGGWADDKKIDEDVNFWRKWNLAGNTLFLANRVTIGHAELMVRWPGADLQAVFQPMREFNETGKAPDGAWQ